MRYTLKLELEYKSETMANARLTIPVATLYAELHDLASLDQPGTRHEGGVAAKTIRGTRYWYHQQWVGKKRVQKFLGAETLELLEKIEDWKKRRNEWIEGRKRRQEICRSLRAALKMKADRLSGKVIARLADSGAFSSGAVLIGTHAYMTYSAMLGHQLSYSSLQTSDVDGAAIDVATDYPEISFSDLVKDVDDDFFVVPPKPGALIATSLKYKGGDIRIELLTTGDETEFWKPKVIRSMRFGALVTPYLDYLLENPVQATYLYDDGILVKVPHPARFAIHKLIVSANRDIAAQTKSQKDVAQASELIGVLDDIRPYELEEAIGDLQSFGGEYVRLAQRGARNLDRGVQELLPNLLW